MRHWHTVVSPVDVRASRVGGAAAGIGGDVGVFIVRGVAVLESKIGAGGVARAFHGEATMRSAQFTGGIRTIERLLRGVCP